MERSEGAGDEGGVVGVEDVVAFLGVVYTELILEFFEL